MPERPFIVDSPTGAALHTYRARPGRPPRAILLILHGLAEHAGRYRALADELAREGIAVYAHDHRGHGSTTAVDAPLRRFAGRDGPAKLLRDIHAVRARAEHDDPGCPVFVLGHSLGGHLALLYAQRFGDGLAGVMAWNAGLDGAWQRRLGAAALRAERALKGSDVASALFARATFETWARAIEGRRTGFDWLSHDAAAVDRYVADPLCGWAPTVSMAADVLEIVGGCASPDGIAAIPHDLPIHLLGGSDDPATQGGRTVTALADVVSAGRRGGETTSRVVTGARHEILNETAAIRAVGVAELLDFVAHHGAVMPKPPGAP